LETRGKFRMKLRYFTRLFILLIIISVLVILYFSGLNRYISFAYFNANKAELLLYVHRNFMFSAFCFVGIYVLASVFFLPITPLLAVASGFIFGISYGVLFTIIGATIGAVLGFLLTKYILGILIQKRYKKKLEKFNREVKEHGGLYLFALRFSPFIPFVFVNLIAGLTSIPLTTFFVSTVLGVIPISFIYAFAGNRFGNISSSADVMSFDVIFALILLVLLSLLPLLIKRKMRKKLKIK